MSPNRDQRDRSRSRHTHRSKHEHEDASVDSGYGGSVPASPKLPHEATPRDRLVEPARHDVKSTRRAIPPHDHDASDEKDDGHSKQKDSDSDADYDPRDRYYINLDDGEYEDISFRKSEALKDDHTREDKRKQQHRNNTSTSSGPSTRDRHRHISSSSRRRDPVSSAETDHGGRRNVQSTRDTDISNTRANSRGQRSPSPPRPRLSKASAASHSRHESNYRSLSPIPSDSGTDFDYVSPTKPRREASSRRSPRSSQGVKTTKGKGQDSSVGWMNPEGETPNSFLQKLMKGIDIKSVGRVGLDAAAVAAIKVAVGTRIPWQQRIPKTIAAGAAAAIMDYVTKKTSFQPKGMVGTMFARHFVEIILANLIINPVSTKVTGATQKMRGGGKMTMASSRGGGGKGRR